MKLFTTLWKKNFAAIIAILAAVSFSCNKDVKELTIRVTSRMYQGYREEHKVKLYEKFPIADTDLEGVVVEFYPDFSIDTLTHQAISLSDTLYNPAAKVLIIEGKEKREEAWAFPPGMMAHFSPKSFIGFELVDYKTSDKYIKPARAISNDGK